jgi:hypothetical protein
MRNEETAKALEDGRYFLARQLMLDGKREEALKAFSALKSPLATLCQAKVSKK